MGGSKLGLVSRQVVVSKGATRTAICVDEPFQSKLVSTPKTRADQRKKVRSGESVEKESPKKDFDFFRKG
ncbi:hypothetical protein LIER_08498 [Lithospermum erythrorhizon]|uniref:Uncharacterized protein n=1 Tax=Lithospermum erythrorhizon TaxID=34254 RepID=A0AAV3PCA7_LITER